MGALKDKVRGAANVGTGRLKQGLARDLGDRRMNSAGRAQETKGYAQRTMGEVKQTVGNFINKIGSFIKNSGN